MVRLHVPLPAPGDPALTQRVSNQYRYAGQTNPNAYAQVERQRWRAALLWLKAQKEAIDLHFLTFEQAFLTHLLLPDGSTAGQFLLPQIAVAYDTGQMPRTLPGLPDPGAGRLLGPGKD